MKSLIGVYDLFNRQTNAYEDASLFEGIDEKNLQDFETHWIPLFHEAKPDEITRETILAANMEDAGWEWRKVESDIRDKKLLYEIFALECAGITQGLMLVNKLYSGKHPEHEGEYLIYVELVATAPWNRDRLVPSPVYSGVGRTLISTAISLSIDEEFKGRIGLHSLLGAETFYTNIGMTDLGKDEKKNGLRYFEMTEESATAFLKG